MHDNSHFFQIRQSKQLQDKLTKQQKLTAQLEQELNNVRNSLQTDGPNSASSSSSSSSSAAALRRTTSTSAQQQQQQQNGPLSSSSLCSSNGSGRFVTSSSASIVVLERASELSLSSMQNNQKLRKE